MLIDIQTRIEAACRRAGRDPGEVKLVAVTKGHDVEEIEREVLNKGHGVLGENRVQEWRDKAAAFDEMGADDKLGISIEWHMLGNLQRNKVKYCTPFALIHSLNSVRLADELERQGEKRDHVFRALVEVNVADEDSKRGAGLEEAERLVEYARGLEHVEVKGLMAMAPYADNPEASRPTFVKLHTLRDRLKLEELSMGMSGDFEVAIEEGATIVRIGTAVFAPEPKTARKG